MMLMLDTLSTWKQPASIFHAALSDVNDYYDCDCTVKPVTHPRLLPEIDFYSRPLYRHPQLQMIPVSYQGQRYYAAFVPGQVRVVVCDANARAILDAFDQTESYWRDLYDDFVFISNAEAVVRTLIQTGLLTPNADTAAVIAPAQELSAWLHVTNACDLACTYCYIHKSSEKMSAETGTAAIDAIIRAAVSNHYQQIGLKFAGGEPLLAFDLVRQLFVYAQEQAEAAGLVVRGSLLTNGVGLTSRRAEQIAQLGLKVTVSLDGLGTAHDLQRPTRTGMGSSELAKRGLRNALAAGIIPAVSVTITADSTNSLPELVDWLLEADLPFNMHFYRQHEGSVLALQVEEAKIVAIMRRILGQLRAKLPRRSLLSGLVDYADLSYSHEYGCAAGQNYLVFDHRGRLSTCQMLQHEPVGSVDSPDALKLIRSADISIHNVPVDEKEGCKDCAWRYWCAGGCPVQTFRATGRVNVKSPNCGIYKALYPEIIALEALRLLHYDLHGDPCS